MIALDRLIPLSACPAGTPDELFRPKLTGGLFQLLARQRFDHAWLLISLCMHMKFLLF